MPYTLFIRTQTIGQFTLNSSSANNLCASTNSSVLIKMNCSQQMSTAVQIMKCALLQQLLVIVVTKIIWCQCTNQVTALTFLQTEIEGMNKLKETPNLKFFIKQRRQLYRVGVRSPYLSITVQRIQFPFPCISPTVLFTMHVDTQQFVCIIYDASSRSLFEVYVYNKLVALTCSFIV